jgi:hypothetical protein
MDTIRFLLPHGSLDRLGGGGGENIFTTCQGRGMSPAQAGVKRWKYALWML